MSDKSLVRIALATLRENAEYLADARVGAPLGNSVVGSILAITTQSPRWATEQAVLDAIAVIDAEKA